MKINIGAGKWKLDGWLTMGNHTKYDTDYDITYDLTSPEPFPLENESVELFYCMHVFEHLSNKTIEHVMKEVYRCLQPNGGIRILVPDVVQAYNDYINRDYYSDWSLAYHRQKHYPFLKDPYYLQEVFYSRQDVDGKEFKENLKKMKMLELFEHYTKNKTETNGHDHINWFTPEKFNEIFKKVGMKMYHCKPGESKFPEFELKHFDYFKARDKISLIVEGIKE